MIHSRTGVASTSGPRTGCAGEVTGVQKVSDQGCPIKRGARSTPRSVMPLAGRREPGRPQELT